MQSIVTPVNDTSFTANYDTINIAYSLGNDTMICRNDALILDAGSSYTNFVWTDGSVGQTLTVLSSVPDTFTVGVTVMNASGDVGNDSITVIVDICSGVDPASNSSVNIYPIPSSGEITIEGVQENYHIDVIDVTGRIIMRKETVPADKSTMLNLPEGIYYINILNTRGELISSKSISVVK
jgi:hypothetical protein